MSRSRFKMVFKDNQDIKVCMTSKTVHVDEAHNSRQYTSVAESYINNILLQQTDILVSFGTNTC